MKFKKRNLRQIAEMVVGDAAHFPYRTGSEISEFFDECNVGYRHDGTTRWSWTVDRLSELLQEPAPQPHALPDRFVHVLRVLMDKSDAEDGDPDRSLALDALNGPLIKEGFEGNRPT